MAIIRAEFKSRDIHLRIRASAEHCDRECPGMKATLDRCSIFSLPLPEGVEEGKRRRLNSCKTAELRVTERNITPQRRDQCTRGECDETPQYIIRWVSVEMRRAVYAFCCTNHLVEFLSDHQQDVADESFRLERV